MADDAPPTAAPVPASPKHAALWSHPQVFSPHRAASPITTSIIGIILAVALALEMAADGSDGLLSVHKCAARAAERARDAVTC